MARNEQLIRQHRILQILEQSRFGRTLSELRDDLVDQLGLDQLSERTVRRDLEALQVSGVDVECNKEVRGMVWKLGPKLQGLPEVAVTCTELLALSLGRDLLVLLRGTPFWRGIESLWHKMQDILPESIWKHFEKQRQSFLVRRAVAKSYGEKQGILDTINRAIQQHRVLQIDYQSNNDSQPRTREIEPITLILYQESVYLVARYREDPPTAEPRHYKLDRFSKAVALDLYFEPPEDFDPTDHYAHCLGIYRQGQPSDFRIRCSATVAAWIRETPWHPHQQIHTTPSGALELFIPAVYETDILPKVLALGVEAEILAPESARECMRHLLQNLQQRYQNSASRHTEPASARPNQPSAHTIASVAAEHDVEVAEQPEPATPR